MFKRNLTARTLSFITAISIGVPIGLTILLLENNLLAGILVFIAVGLAVYLFIYAILHNYINHRINIIYKFIQQTKASKKEEIYYKFILPQKTLDDVHADVEAWAEHYNQEMELLEKNETFRKEFLQNLSHEIKTPVFAIQGYIDTLLEGALENPDVNRRFLQKAANNTERLVNLINDLDEISKLERGELKLHKQYFVVQDLIKEVFDSLLWKSEQRHINFTIKKESETPVTVFADKEKVRQVLSNLVDNSIKYGKYGGTVTASIYQTSDLHILIEVTDDGMGISEKYINRVFERFYRTTEGRGRDMAGTGLGLSICKHIIEAHGHKIHVRSKEGVGTTIGFTLDTKKEERKFLSANQTSQER